MHWCLFELSRLPGYLGFEEQLRGFGEVGLDAVDVDDPETAEDRLVEAPAHLVAGVDVELVRIAEEFDPAADLCDALFEVVLDGAELVLRPVRRDRAASPKRGLGRDPSSGSASRSRPSRSSVGRPVAELARLILNRECRPPLIGLGNISRRLGASRVQFIIVAADDLAPLGRQLAHALSLHEEHSGTYWTLKHYEDNEATLAKQPVIFLGESKVAKSYTEVLPVRFADYGTTCWFEGAKAVLFVDDPDSVSVDDLARFERVVEGRAEELRHIAETTTAAEVEGEASGEAVQPEAASVAVASETPVGVRVALAVQPVFEAGKGAVDFVVRAVNSGKRKRAYLRLQYRYVLDRFLKDEFEDFVAGVDGN